MTSFRHAKKQSKENVEQMEPTSQKYSLHNQYDSPGFSKEHQQHNDFVNLRAYAQENNYVCLAASLAGHNINLAEHEEILQ